MPTQFICSVVWNLCGVGYKKKEKWKKNILLKVAVCAHDESAHKQNDQIAIGWWIRDSLLKIRAVYNYIHIQRRFDIFMWQFNEEWKSDIFLASIKMYNNNNSAIELYFYLGSTMSSGGGGEHSNELLNQKARANSNKFKWIL